MPMNKPRFRGLLEDWPAKALSLLGAAGLFFFYQLNRLEERPLSVPLTVRTNGRYVPASQYPRTVRLVLRGESDAIFAIPENDLVATLDLAGFTSPGVWRVPVRVERRGSAVGIDPLEVSVEPSEVAISIEERVTREVAVTPSFRGYLEPGYELAGFTLVPDRVQVAGPSGLMAGVTDAVTDPVELSGKSGDFTVRVRLQPRDSLLELVSADVVEFSAEVRKAIVFKTFQDLAIFPSGLAPGLSLRTPLPAGSVRVSASRLELEAFVPGQDTLVADLSGITGPGVYTVAIVPRFPEGFQVESWLPMVGTVSIERAPEAPRAEGVP